MEWGDIVTTLIEKLERFANDPAATPAERESYAAKARKLRGMPPKAKTYPYNPYPFKGWIATWNVKYGKEFVCCCEAPGEHAVTCQRKNNRKSRCACACHHGVKAKSK